MSLNLKTFRERLAADHYANQGRAMATVARSEMSHFEKIQARKAIDEHYADDAPPPRRFPPAPSQPMPPSYPLRGRGGPVSTAPSHALRAAPEGRTDLAGKRPVGRPRKPFVPPPPKPVRHDPMAVHHVKDCAAAVALLLAELKQAHEEPAARRAWDAAALAAERLVKRAADLGAPEVPAAADGAAEGEDGAAA